MVPLRSYLFSSMYSPERKTHGTFAIGSVGAFLAAQQLKTHSWHVLKRKSRNPRAGYSAVPFYGIKVVQISHLSPGPQPDGLNNI